MAGRSLQLSVEGQRQARQALLYKSLTQKAIAYDLGIASWATVNKFFNGKPVDRFIFQEICTVLDLDWAAVVVAAKSVSKTQSSSIQPSLTSPNLHHKQSIEQSLSETTPASTHSSIPSASSLLDAVQAQAAAAREALTPRILERIPREIVREKYLEAIARGVNQEQGRVITIIGPAGYGKSTVLGDIYDELMQNSTPWVGLILCSSLSLSANYRGFISYGLVSSTFVPVTSLEAQATTPSHSQQTLIETAMGASLCGEHRSIVAIAAELSQGYGRGILLIDTLDLVINRNFVVILGTVLRQLIAQGTTIVLTCRDHEYNDYLEPVNQRLPGLSRNLDRYIVPNFTTREIRIAAQAFFRHIAPDQPERGAAFADNILALSTDNRSLREILENPLLLALLCDLFAVDGNVPPDLTVSKLYRRYWQEKVVYSRIEQSHFSPLALAKEALCLQIAQCLFERSATRLYESFYRDELGIEFTTEAIAACNDLLSEGVLTQLVSGKLHFFHQTLLEYAIAYWLTRQSASSSREELLHTLQDVELARDRTHWLPILRQFLAIIDDVDFEPMISRLDIRHMGVFGAIAYAAVSRDHPEALRQLLPTALQQGELYQRRLRQAIAAAPRQLIETVWDVLLILLKDAEHSTASNTVQMVGELLARWWQSLHHRLEVTLEAIAARSLIPRPNNPKGYDDRGQLYGWLLQPCLPLLQSSPDPDSLRALRNHIHLFGHTTLAGVIQSHATAPLADQQDLLERLLQFPVPRYENVKSALVEFVSKLLPQQVAQNPCFWGDGALEILHYKALDQWDAVQIQAIGRWAAQDQTIFQALMQDYLYGSSERMGRNLNALLESLYNGSGCWVLLYLQALKHDDGAIASLNFQRLSKLLPRSVIKHLSVETQEALAQWLQPYLPEQIHNLYALLNVLAEASPTAHQTLQQWVGELPPDLRQQMHNQLLRFQPIEIHPPLNTLSKKEQRSLIAVYQRQARNNPKAFAKLMEISLGTAKDAAMAASQNLAQVGGDFIELTMLLPLLNSPFVGVRVNGIEAIAAFSRSKPLSPTEMAQLCSALAEEDSQTVARYFYDLITEWVRHQRRVLPAMVVTIAALLTRVVAAGQFEGGLGRSLVLALKVIVRTEEPTLDCALLSQIMHHLLNSLHLIQIKNGESEVIDVLCGIHRLNPTFLRDAVYQDCPALLERCWIRNISTLIKTIRKIEGVHSPLLDEMIQRYGDRPEIESLVLEARGA